MALIVPLALSIFASKARRKEVAVEGINFHSMGLCLVLHSMVLDRRNHLMLFGGKRSRECTAHVVRQVYSYKYHLARSSRRSLFYLLLPASSLPILSSRIEFVLALGRDVTIGPAVFRCLRRHAKQEQCNYTPYYPEMDYMDRASICAKSVTRLDFKHPILAVTYGRRAGVL